MTCMNMKKLEHCDLTLSIYFRKYAKLDSICIDFFKIKSRTFLELSTLHSTPPPCSKPTGGKEQDGVC